jgi:hypothetical protein
MTGHIRRHSIRTRGPKGAAELVPEKAADYVAIKLQFVGLFHEYCTPSHVDVSILSAVVQRARDWH